MRVLIAALLALLVTAPAAAGGSAPDTSAGLRISATDEGPLSPFGSRPVPEATSSPAPATPAAAASADAYGLSSRTRLWVGYQLFDIVAVPLDGDAFPDLVVTGISFSNPVIMLLWNDGTGAFPTRTEILLPRGPRGIAARDLDADGDLDLVVTGGTWYPDGSIEVVRNDGGHVFTPLGPLRVGSAPQRPILVDVTGDGIVDVVAPCYENDSLWIAIGTGGTAFAAPVGVPAARFGTTAGADDVDGDGRPELLLAYEDCNSISMFRTGASGVTYAGEVPFHWGAIGMGLVDMAGTGARDLIVGTSHATYSVLENVAGGFPAWLDIPTHGAPFDLTGADLDGDGLAEVIGSEFGVVTVVARASGGGCTIAHWGAGAEGAIAVADLDLDGRLDAVVAPRWGTTLELLWGAGGAQFRTPRLYSVGGSPANAATADLDGDGVLDVVTALSSGAGSRVGILRGRAGGGFDPAQGILVGDSPRFVTAGDLDGDGRPELVTANQAGGGISILHNDGAGGFDLRTDVATGYQPFCVALGDLDGDGNLDAVVANYSDNTVSVLRGLGDATLTPWQALSASIGPTGVTLADLDLDGDLDLAVACYESDVVRVYRNDGTGGLSEVDATVCTGGPWRISTTSLPAWSSPVLLVACRKHDYVTALAAASPLAYTVLTSAIVGMNPSSVVAADLDGDGLLEAITSDSGGGTLSVIRGVTIGLGAVSTYSTGSGPEAALFGDFSGDGIADLATADLGSQTLSTFTRRLASAPGVDVPGDLRGGPMALEPIRPNPARELARIAFTLAGPGPARLSIVDLSGRRLRMLASGSFAAGRHEVAWDGHDADQRAVAAGMYFCVLEAGERRESRRLMWLR